MVIMLGLIALVIWRRAASLSIKLEASPPKRVGRRMQPKPKTDSRSSEPGIDRYCI